MFVNSVTEEEKLIVKLSGTRWWRGGKQREKRWPMQIDGLSQPMAQLSHLQHLIVPPTHTPPPPLSSLHSLNAHCTRTLPLPFYLQLSLLTPITFTLWIWDIYIYISLWSAFTVRRDLDLDLSFHWFLSFLCIDLNNLVLLPSVTKRNRKWLR